MYHGAIRLPALVLAALSLSACSINLNAERVNSTEEKRFAVTGTPELSLVTPDGTVQVKSWDKPEVLVVIERSAGNPQELEQIQVSTSQDGNRITVEAKVGQRHGGVNIGMNVSPQANFTVTVPRETNLTARTGDGGVTVEAVKGRVVLHTGDGGIQARALDGDVKVHTGDGGVALQDVSGTIDLDTGDGGVRVSGTLAKLKLHTGDGAVQVHGNPGTSATEDWEITTGDGPVTLELPGTFSAELDAHTGDGRIVLEGFPAPSESADANKNDLKTRLGTGGKRLAIRSGDGGITVRKI